MPEFGGVRKPELSAVGRGWCELCEKSVPLCGWPEHVRGASHTFAVERVKFERERREEGVEPPPPDVKLLPNHVWCALCATQVSIVGTGWRRHVGGSSHKQATQSKRLAALAATKAAGLAEKFPKKPAAAAPGAAHRKKLNIA